MKTNENDLRTWLICLFCSATLGVPVQALEADALVAAADEQQSATQPSNSTQLEAEATREEVIVTARKRQESLLRVPVTEIVLSQDTLEQYATHDLFTLSAQVPGLVLGISSGVLGPQVSMRGIGATSINATLDQSVSLNVDGLSLTQGFAYQAGMFDVAQVEALKGPQALFYGKNSPAGVISFRSADPTDKAEFILRPAYEGVAQESSGEVIASGPVFDSLKLRLAARYSTDNGYFRNPDTAPADSGVRSPTTDHFQTGQHWIVRGTALFGTPSGVYDARLKLNYTDDSIEHGSGDTQVANCPGGVVSFTGLPVFDPNEDCKLNRDFYVSWLDPSAWPEAENNGVPFQNSDQQFGTLDQNFHFGDMTLTSVTGYYEYHQHVFANGSESSGIVALGLGNSFSNRQFTQELRLASNFSNSPVNFMVGGFYQDGTMQNHVRIFGATVLGLPPLLQDAIHDVDIESISGFGQVIWNITDEVELAAGARYTDETRDHTEFNVATLGAPVGPTPLLDPHLSSTDTSPEVTLTYRPTDDLTLFGSYKQGYKSGSFNTLTFIDSTTKASFGDEKGEGYELGLKTRMLDGRLSLNLSAYYYDYTGLQVSANEITPAGVIAINTINAAAANSKGIDLDSTYALASISGLKLRGAVSYNKSRYDSFPNAPCGNNQTISQGCDQLFSAADGAFHAQDLGGRPLVRAPEWVINAGVDYEAAIGQDMMLMFGGGATYTSEYYTALIAMPGFIQDAFTKVNANVALRGRNDAWEVALIGNNLTDEITTGFCFNSNQNGLQIFGGQQSGKDVGGPAGDDYAVCGPERGREVWLRLTLRMRP